MIYYKVTDTLNRSINPRLPADYSTQYVLGREVKPNVKGTKLFCFNNLERAYRFCAQLNQDYFVYECEITNPGKPKFLSHIGSYYFSLFWNNKNKHKKIHEDSFLAPLGTVSCDSIKLIRLVDSCYH